MLKKSATSASRLRFSRSTPCTATLACCLRCSRFILVGETASGMLYTPNCGNEGSREQGTRNYLGHLVPWFPSSLASSDARFVPPRLLHKISKVVLLDVVLFDALEFPFGERGEESPAQRQRIFDRALGLALVEEPSLELFGEFQVEAIAIRERFLSDDRHQFAQVDAVGVGGVELVAQRAVVLARAALADAGVHQPGKAAQRSNRRVEPQPVQLAAEQNMSFRDLVCQVGGGVGDIVVGHLSEWMWWDRSLSV